MKLTKKCAIVGLTGIMALSMAVSAWAAEPKVTDQKIHAGEVKINMPVVVGAVGGADVDNKINLALDFNIIKKLYNYLPGSASAPQMEEAYYSEFGGEKGSADSRKFVTDVAGFINRQLQNQAKTAHQAGSHVKKYTFNGKYQVRFNSEDMLSLEQIYMDYLGGAHPNTYLDTVNVDLKTGRILSLGDMFKTGSDYLTRLNKLVEKQAAENQDKGYFDKIEITGDENFYINDNAELVIVYPPYDVAPYAAGIVEFPIPVSQLADIFNFKLEQ